MSAIVVTLRPGEDVQELAERVAGIIAQPNPKAGPLNRYPSRKKEDDPTSGWQLDAGNNWFLNADWTSKTAEDDERFTRWRVTARHWPQDMMSVIYGVLATFDGRQVEFEDAEIFQKKNEAAARNHCPVGSRWVRQRRTRGEALNESEKGTVYVVTGYLHLKLSELGYDGIGIVFIPEQELAPGQVLGFLEARQYARTFDRFERDFRLAPPPAAGVESRA